MRGYKHVFEQGDGWYRIPSKSRWLNACCDCCLVHHIERKLVKRGTGYELWVRMSRDEEETAALRKAKKKRGPAKAEPSSKA